VDDRLLQQLLGVNPIRADVVGQDHPVQRSLRRVGHETSFSERYAEMAVPPGRSAINRD
jgi:hypothetical protein